MSVVDTRLPSLLRGTRPLLGLFVGIPSPALVEMAGHAGFDFVVIDNEHGPAGIETTEHLLRAAKCGGVIPVVRTLEADILRVLDIGASAIQVPQVNTADQARRIVAAAKYSPIGQRGAAFSTRAAGYGFFGGPAHVQVSNDGTSVIVMAETREAIDNLDAIVAVPGIDAVFFGPNDLSFSLGHPGLMRHPDVVNAIERGIERVLAAGVAPGVLAASVEDFHRWAKHGARYLPMVASGLIGGAMRQAVESTKSKQ
ncbi:MAG TPA: aldolase/citrate lyase family protein [Casimicrobiaceae bacterium]|nr:aldolase/citrate lyase family protein [Casimicrobiaceae bacterium]